MNFQRSVPVNWKIHMRRCLAGYKGTLGIEACYGQGWVVFGDTAWDCFVGTDGEHIYAGKIVWLVLVLYIGMAVDGSYNYKMAWDHQPLQLLYIDQ